MPIWLIQLIVGVILSAVSTLIQQALAPKQQEQNTLRGFRGSVQTGGKVPQSFLIGTIGVPGKLEYRNSWGSAGGTPNAYLVDVISFGDLPIAAMTGLYVNAEKATIEVSGHTTQGFPVTEFDDGTDHLWVEFWDGTQTTVNSYLSAKFGADVDRPWESDMIGRGVPYVTLTALVSETLWTGFPSYMAEFRGIKLYDPRKDTTAGGSGSQRWDTPSTWAFSDNSMVIIYNILRGIHYAGAWVWGGRARAAQLPYAEWAAAMDACDEDVALDAGGTEKRFRAGREISLNERPADVIGDLLTGCTGRLAQVAGVWYPLVGVPGEADGSFTDDDLIVTEGMTFDPFPNLDQIINGATATYLEPQQAWEAKETAPYYRSNLEAEDDGRRQVQGIDLVTTFSGTQAQRVLKATVEESRRFRRHVVQVRPSFGVYRPLQVLAWTSADQGYDAKLFLITAKTELPNGNIILGLQEIDPADYAWSTADEQPIDFAPMQPIRPAPQPMAGFAVSPYIFADGGANSRRPGILLEYSGGLDDIRAVAFQVREDFGAGNTVATGEITYDIAIADPAQPIGGQWTLPATAYEVRAKFLPPDGSGRVTTWSDWLAITTPNVRLGRDDIVPIIELAGDVLNQLASVRSLIEQFEQLGTLIEAQDLANYNDRKTLRRELVAKVGDLEASFNEIIEVAIGPGGAIATALESLYAAMGGNTAEVNVRWQSVAAPSGYSARYAIQAAVNDGTFRSATFFLDVPADPDEPTRIGFMAGQTVFFTSGGTPIALFDETGKFKSANGVYVLDMFTGAESVTIED